MLYRRPLTLRQANALVTSWHRHHKPARGQRFAIGATDGHDQLVGAAISGRPVSRELDQDLVCEVLRLVTDGHKNACSFLYAASARTAKEWGFAYIQTYILASEPGTSLRAAGWTFGGLTKGGDWNCTVRTNRRTDQPQEPKQRWYKILNPHWLDS